MKNLFRNTNFPFFDGVRVSLVLSAILYLLGIGTISILLSGCGLTPQGDAIREYVKDTGATVADNALENSEWVICYAASVGSIKRRYGVTTETMDTYNNFCERPNVDFAATNPAPIPP